MNESPNEEALLLSNDRKGRKQSISEAFVNSINSSMSPNAFDVGGRSYVGSFIRSSLQNQVSPTIFSGDQVHEQSAYLANIGVTEDGEEPQNILEEENFTNNEIDEYHNASPISIMGGGDKGYESIHETSDKTPLILKRPGQNVMPLPDQYNDLEVGIIQDHQLKREEEQQTSSLQKYILKPISYTPAVFLGTLLNILDGLSYGMIMFPISEAVFSSLAPSGLSMFYVSCIVSQLIYSLGGSAFKAGIGSEMIEVTPFFHSMAMSIMAEMKGASDDAIIATTIVTYAVSSIVTGLVFFCLGKLKLGSLVGFFPRHILVGCIGGVGYFLIATGIEVSSRMEGGLVYNLATLKMLFLNYITFLQWSIPLALAVFLIILQHKYHNALIVPAFFIAVFVLFHLLVLVLPVWSLEKARNSGWVFPAVENNEPWYGFYKLYKFQLVDWFSVLRQLPSMLALTFFGILHVPINVPALAVTVGMDRFDVDRELVAHGYSNAISGLVGSIQNYLVYTNSVLFIRAGADDRAAGVLLAIGTAAVMVAGPGVIGYIPVCVVGSLIYLLGYELLKESVYDTRGKLKKIEYCTIIIIVVTMGVFDFVIGIFVGIMMACLSFVVEAARSPVVKGIYSGSVVKSTVLRHPKQQEFLKYVRDQICIIKLQGTVFFGSIGGVETAIMERFENSKFNQQPIKFLIMDMKGVDLIDFSSAEGFRRILNLLNEFKTQFIISSVRENDEVVKALRDAGLWDNDQEIKLFDTLNNGLEWCENTFLNTYKSILGTQSTINIFNETSSHRSISESNSKSLMNQAFAIGTPRSNQVINAAKRTARDEQRMQSRFLRLGDSSFKKQPLPLIMITFLGLSTKDEKFWGNITKYFVQEKVPENFMFYDSSQNKPAFFILESGLIESSIEFENNKKEIRSSILPMTAFGDLVDSKQYRQIKYSTINDCVVWKISEKQLAELLQSPNGEELYKELLQINYKLLRERFDTMTNNLIISA